MKTVAEMAREVKMPYDFETGEPINLEKLKAFADLVAAAERDTCAYWAGIALLGADRGLANRVDQAIRARGAKHDPA